MSNVQIDSHNFKVWVNQNIYEKYVVLSPGSSGKKYGELIDESEFLELDDQFGIDSVSDTEIDDDNYFSASMGGEAIKELLTNLDVVNVISELLELVNNKATSISKRDEALKRLRVIDHFIASDASP